MNLDISDLINKILSAAVVAGVSWLLVTTINHRTELKLMDYKLDQLNIVLQDIYETKEKKSNKFKPSVKYQDIVKD